jgi:very-short-patch-repair endonuclease
MEMTWMETFRLLGVDLLAVLLVVVVALDGVEHLVHSAHDSRRKHR